MLEIEGLSDKDALFYFRDGLKDWAKIELDRRDVHTLDDAIAAAEMLTDFSSKTKKAAKKEEEVSESDESDGHKTEGIHKNGRWNGKKKDRAAEKIGGKSARRPVTPPP